jgi:hypothetical protein
MMPPRSTTSEPTVVKGFCLAGWKAIAASLVAEMTRPVPPSLSARASCYAPAEAESFPDLLARSADILRDLFGEALGTVPEWARPLSFTDYFGIRHRRFRDQLADMLADAEERITINRRAGELIISFGGDTNQAGQFARSVPGGSASCAVDHQHNHGTGVGKSNFQTGQQLSTPTSRALRLDVGL